jgi:hypothetical protein
VEEEEEEKEAGLGVTGREDIVRESGGDMEEMILPLSPFPSRPPARLPL